MRRPRAAKARDADAAADNTNADAETRAVWVALARKAGVRIRCLWLRTPLRVCEHNDAVRALNAALNPEARPALPRLAFTGFAARHKPPRASEGFDDVRDVAFVFCGTRAEYAIWGRYWT